MNILFTILIFQFSDFLFLSSKSSETKPKSKQLHEKRKSDHKIKTNSLATPKPKNKNKKIENFHKFQSNFNFKKLLTENTRDLMKLKRDADILSGKKIKKHHKHFSFKINKPKNRPKNNIMFLSSNMIVSSKEEPEDGGENSGQIKFLKSQLPCNSVISRKYTRAVNKLYFRRFYSFTFIN